jgi:RimJ/RimL family protein N-acetyltransferase
MTGCEALLKGFDAFGLTLHRVTKDDLADICKWRNDPRVRRFMNDRREVNEKVLQLWLNRSEEDGKSLSYVCSRNGKPFGYEEIKDINTTSGTAECGTFFDPAQINSGLALNVFLCREMVLRDLKVSTTLARVRKENRNSLSLQHMLGGEITYEDAQFVIFTICKPGRLAGLKKFAFALGFEEEFDREFSKWQ